MRLLELLAAAQLSNLTRPGPQEARKGPSPQRHRTPPGRTTPCRAKDDPTPNHPGPPPIFGCGFMFTEIQTARDTLESEYYWDAVGHMRIQHGIPRTPLQGYKVPALYILDCCNLYHGHGPCPGRGTSTHGHVFTPGGVKKKSGQAPWIRFCVTVRSKSK